MTTDKERFYVPQITGYRMNRHEAGLASGKNNPFGKQRDADAGRYAADDRIKRAKFQRPCNYYAKSSQKRFEALAVGAAESKNDGPEILNFPQILRGTYRWACDKDKLFGEKRLLVDVLMFDRACDERTVKPAFDNVQQELICRARSNREANPRVGARKCGN